MHYNGYFGLPMKRPFITCNFCLGSETKKIRDFFLPLEYWKSYLCLCRSQIHPFLVSVLFLKLLLLLTVLRICCEYYIEIILFSPQAQGYISSFLVFKTDKRKYDSIRPTGLHIINIESTPPARETARYNVPVGLCVAVMVAPTNGWLLSPLMTPPIY